MCQDSQVDMFHIALDSSQTSHTYAATFQEYAVHIPACHKMAYIEQIHLMMEVDTLSCQFVFLSLALQYCSQSTLTYCSHHQTNLLEESL